MKQPLGRIYPKNPAICAASGMACLARYAWEFDAVELPQGHLLTLTVTKRF